MKTKINGLTIFDKDGERVVSANFAKQKAWFLVPLTSAFVILSVFFLYQYGLKALPAVPFVLFIWLVSFLFAVRVYIKITKKTDGSLGVVTSDGSVFIHQNTNAKIVYSKSGLIYDHKTKIYYKDGSGQDQEFVLDNLRGGRSTRFILSKTQAEEIARQLGVPFEVRD